MKIQMYKADNGDCISIKTQSEFILIDGGTAQSFSNWSMDVTGAGQKIDAVIVTHIDNDHINGIIKLLMHPECPTIGRIYFNGAEQFFGKLSTNNIDLRADFKLKAIYEESKKIAEKTKIGHSEGTSLSYLISNESYKCNDIVDGNALYREICDHFYIGNLKLSIIGPNKDDLFNLKNVWEDKLKEKNINPRIINKSHYDSFEQYTGNIRGLLTNSHQISSTEKNCIFELANSKFYDDESPTNRSSFAFLIEHDGKKIIYLGDCHASVFISWLDENRIDTIKVDAVKISHHGSKNNTSLELLKRIECNKFLISTNGQSHGHPDIETLARIAFVNADSDVEIHFNYSPDTIPDWFKDELNNNYPRTKLLMNSCEVNL